ncbi:hypothetical protein [Hymenobacter sp. GOD-10R]|uniref:hypothetical protein n=1 Tax=Hymenobacter sp. GOD-10R TaxID=3093922 RepID=UPI002D79D69E|nr:hypothetical protein [Hymenobacter sp. GOD-10R]WRQ27783.1 hypothetical protein SD425_22170 [Hymenobacter sp. GOD-10R]
MSLSSPLISLIEVLQSVCQQATDHADLLKKNEAATRAALIDPVLRVLGWDTTNVRMVEPEKTVNTAWRADYALHNSQGEIQLLVEAKALGSNLEKFAVVQQLLGYAFGFGVGSIVMTDGINWHFYNEFKPGASTSNSSFNLLQDGLTHCAFSLISWLDIAHFGFVSSKEAMSAIAQLPSVLIHPSSDAPSKTGISKNSNEAQKFNKLSFVELTQINKLQLQPDQKPTHLRLPDGSVRLLRTWKDVLLESCQFVLIARPDIPIPLPDKAGKKRYLFTLEKPTVGSSTPIVHDNKTVYIYTHYSAKDCIANALYILSQIKPQNHSAALSFE